MFCWLLAPLTTRLAMQFRMFSILFGVSYNLHPAQTVFSLYLKYCHWKHHNYKFHSIQFNKLPNLGEGILWLHQRYRGQARAYRVGSQDAICQSDVRVCQQWDRRWLGPWCQLLSWWRPGGVGGSWLKHFSGISQVLIILSPSSIVDTTTITGVPGCCKRFILYECLALCMESMRSITIRTRWSWVYKPLKDKPDGPSETRKKRQSDRQTFAFLELLLQQNMRPLFLSYLTSF